MFREPWFSILEVYEHRGRSMADIVKDVSDATGVSLARMRSWEHKARPARLQAMLAVRNERPDISSGQVGRFFHRDPSIIRKYWKEAA